MFLVLINIRTFGFSPQKKFLRLLVIQEFSTRSFYESIKYKQGGKKK